MSRARACVRYGGVWRAPQKRQTPSTTLAAAVSAAFVAWPKSIDVPLSGPKRQNSSKKGRACSTRGAGGRQALPTPWPVGTAIAHAPDRSHRRPGAVLRCRTGRLPEKGTMLKPRGAAKIKNKKMGMMPRLGAIQWCRLRRGDVGFVIEFGGVCYQDTYPMYRACIVHVSCMYLDVSRSYTSRYIKIHRDTFVSSLWPS